MKSTQLFAALTIVSVSLFPFSSAAVEVEPVTSGNWSSTVVDAPWPGGIAPAATDSVYVKPGVTLTVDTNATIAFVYGEGAMTMSPGVTLDILGDGAGAYGAHQLDAFNATAVGNTVHYHGNPFWAKRTDYHHLIFSGAGDFYNGDIPGAAATPMTIAGDFTLSGTNIAVQQGADMTIGGNLMILGGTNKWDCSSFFLTVTSNTFITGTRALLIDLDGALGYNNFAGGVTVGSNSFAWNVSDVTHWAVGGSLTNQGLIAGKGYGSIDFSGSGIITGKPLKLPTITVSGSYAVGTTITLTTNTPTLLGTLIFDLATTNQLVLQSYPTNAMTFYYSGNLDVINSGAAPVSGNSYKFFSATNYDGAFSATSYPSLPGGLTWVDNLLASGSIAVTGGVMGAPTLAVINNGGVLTLSWDSTTFPGYRVVALTNSAGPSGTWNATGSGTVSPFNVNVNPANPAVFFRLVNP